MSKDTRWDRGLSVTAEADDLAGHAGAVLVRKLADQCGLTAALGAALARAGKFPLIDRGVALVSIAAAIVLGAASISDIALLAHQELVFGAPPADTTIRRTLELADDRALGRIARARAKVRAHVWDLIAATPPGFPWLAIAGKVLTGWLVIDMDATLITAHSIRRAPRPRSRRAKEGSTRWGRGWRTPPSRWRCSCARATRARTPSPITCRCWRRRWRRFPPGGGPGYWSASTGQGRVMTSSGTCCLWAPAAGRCCPPAAG